MCKPQMSETTTHSEPFSRRTPSFMTRDGNIVALPRSGGGLHLPSRNFSLLSRRPVFPRKEPRLCSLQSIPATSPAYRYRSGLNTLFRSVKREYLTRAIADTYRRFRQI